MSYTPTTWTTGDTISASALNKIEQGIAGAGSALVCNSSYDSGQAAYVLDHTAKDIYDALIAGTPVYIKYQYGDFETYSGSMYLAPIVKVFNYQYTEVIRFAALKPKDIGAVGEYYYVFAPSILVYTADGEDSYPVYYRTIVISADVLSTSSDKN